VLYCWDLGEKTLTVRGVLEQRRGGAPRKGVIRSDLVLMTKKGSLGGGGDKRTFAEKRKTSSKEKKTKMGSHWKIHNAPIASQAPHPEES